MRTIGGSGLEFEERGRGEVVFLVHAGVFGDWFAPLFGAPELDGFRVIRPHRSGYGDSRPPAGHLTIRDHAGQCGALLRALGIRRAHWVGHSSSCCVGLQLALDDPGLVASLTLFEPARPAGPLHQGHMGSYIGPAVAAAGRGDFASALDTFLNGVCGHDCRHLIDEHLGRDGYDRAVRDAAFFFADELPAVREWDFGEAEATRITAPVLAAYGAGSGPWFPENVELLARMLPAAETAALPYVDHAAPLQDPTALALLIAEFVNRQARGPVGELVVPAGREAPPA